MAPRKWKNPSQIDGQNTRIYNMWLHMRNRCTNGSRSQAYSPTYIGCTLYQDWYSYDMFHEWVTSNIYHDTVCRNNIYYQLDKDLLIKQNKIYSPDTCEFLPKEINLFLTKRERCRGTTPLGVYLFRGTIFRAIVSNPFTNKLEHLGLYPNPVEGFLAYKQRKESLAKEFCRVYENKLPDRVVSALMSYTVEITD